MAEAAAPYSLGRRSGAGSEAGRNLPGLSTASRWREHLVYAAMSLLVVWHTLVMVVAAAPESAITKAARTVVHPYLTLFNLDNHWGFFAPDVGTTYQLRYIVKDASGQEHMFIPTDKLNRLSPTSIWLRDRYREVLNSVNMFGPAAVAELCREHSALRPTAITLLGAYGKEFGPDDRRRGKNPLDPEFVIVRAIRTISCPGT